MSAVMAWVFGGLALGLGLLNTAPRLGERTWTTQMALPEVMHLPLAICAAAILTGWMSGQSVPLAFGLVGVGLCGWPLLHIQRAVRAHDAQMRRLTGEDYPANVPTHHAVQPRRWSLSQAITGAWKHRDIRVERDVVFVERPTRPLKCDIYHPNQPPAFNGRHAAVIVLHPGAWSVGDKSWYFEPHDRALAACGFVVIDCQYRFVDEVGWPAQMDDARAAIRWVKANAERLNIDPERVAILGRSSGGHVALSTAFRATGAHADTRVRAVVTLYAPTNLTIIGEHPGEAIYKLFGGNPDDCDAVYRDGTPLFFAHPECPPTLMVHGQRDGVAHWIHADQMRWQLQRHGVPVGVLRVPWSHHSFDVSPIGLGAQLTQYHIDRFLVWSLSDER
ncbi:MAG: alpha/beta hydrolase [Anaerolineae bacterium]|nr:alpha/beta hydrolase [Anaerolineae bacterium]